MSATAKRYAIAAAIIVLLTPATRLFAVASCSWTTVPTTVNFGTYSPFAVGPDTTTAAVAFNCVPPASATLKFSTGNSGSFNRALARTTTPASSLSYNVYTTAAGTTIWGDGTAGTQFVTFTGTPGNKDWIGQLYGIVPAGVDAAPGTYTDTIQATLSGSWGTDTRAVAVTATIVAECTVSTSPLNFGTYDPLVSNATTSLDSTTLVNVYCTRTTPATVTLDAGTNASGAQRRMMTPAGAFMNYEIYRDSARTTVWNTTNTNSGTSTSKLTPIGGGFVAYGRVPAGQDVSIGNYTDTVTVTVNY